MKSRDPWDTIMTDPAGNVILPRGHYGLPFYREVPSWIHYGEGGGTTRQLFDGAFVSGWFNSTGDSMTNIGAELTALSLPGYGFYRPYGSFYRPPFYPPYGRVFFGAENPPARQGLTAELAPVVAPATGGITVKKELDDKQVLHVEICVDGKCYRTSMDLAPAITMILGKLAQWHRAQHAQMAVPEVPPAVVSTIDAAVGTATEALIGSLVARHVDCVCGSFLGDITKAVSFGVGGLAGGVAATFKKFKKPIGVAAGIAAASGAVMIPGVGPFVAPLAGKLANDLVQASAGDNTAKKRVAQANQQAQTDPVVAAALQAAQKAVATSTVAHHVQETAKSAARGDAASQRQIVKVADDAEKGDPAAKAVADLIANAMKSEWGAELWEKVTGRGPSVSGEWYDITVGKVPGTILGATLADVRRRALELAKGKVGEVVGVIHSKRDNIWYIYAFGSLDDSIDWLQRSTQDRASFTYAAVYEKTPDGLAFLQDEEIGGSRRPAAPPAEKIRRGIATA